MGLKETLHKIPPLGWAGIAASGGLFLVWRNHNKAKKAATSTPEQNAVDYNSQLNPRDTSIDAGVGQGGMFEHVAPAATPAAQSIVSNSQWGIYAINHLIGLGNPAADADNAIRKYLSARGLTANEQSLVNIVLGKFGAPPNLLPVATDPQKGLTGYFKKTYAAVGDTGAAFFGNPGDDKNYSIDPAVYAAYDDNTYRWISPTEWADITVQHGGTAPLVQLMEATSDLFTKYHEIGLKPPAWVSPKGVTPYAVIRPDTLPGTDPDLAHLPPSTHIFTVGSTFMEGGGLFSLAQIIYGDGNKWPLIWNLNRDRIPDPNVLYEGQKLVVPNYTVGAGIQGPYNSDSALSGYDTGAYFASRQTYPQP